MSNTAVVSTVLPDEMDEMKQKIDEIPLKSISVNPSNVFRLTKKHFHNECNTHNALDEKQVISHVKNIRTQMSGNDFLGRLKRLMCRRF